MRSAGLPGRDIAGIVDETAAPAEAVRPARMRNEKLGEQGGVAGPAETQSDTELGFWVVTGGA